MSARVVLCLALLLLSGCVTTAPTAPASAPSSDASSADASDLESLYWQRQRDARSEFVQADVDFMTGMIGHHAQALVMSRLAPTHGASPAVRRLAARIINAQNDEIESMQRWLRTRGQPVPVPRVEGLMLTVSMEMPPDSPADGETEAGGMDHSTMDHSAMGHGAQSHGGMDHGAMDHSSMPGMLSQAQLEELDAARGLAFDRLFLRYMIQHHGGATAMADTLFSIDGAALGDDAFKLASDINVDQATEIARMELMLQELTD